jgi:hypothetical protein
VVITSLLIDYMLSYRDITPIFCLILVWCRATLPRLKHDAQ